MSCPICISNYNKSTQTAITCHFVDCNYTACRTCIRTYLINTTHEPHCMNCKKKWDYEFAKNALTPSYMKSDYRKHRANILTDRMISQRELYIDKAKEYKETETIREEIKKCNREIRELNILQNKIKDRLKNLNEDLRNIHLRRNGVTAAAAAEAPKEEKKRFIMPCQQPECKGMLSQAYKCGLCDKMTCSQCLEPKTGYKHECNPDSIETAIHIRENSKPCPNCGTRISRISGCPQMWCVECNTAFCWNTGKIETKNIHNPHYFEYLQKTGRQPQNQCGNQFQFRDIVQSFTHCNRLIKQAIDEYSKYKQASKYYYPTNFENCPVIKHIDNTKILFCKMTEPETRQLAQAMSHLNEMVLNNFVICIDRNRERAENSMIRYMIGEYSEEELKKQLINIDNENIKYRGLHDIYDAYIGGTRQMMQTLNELFLKTRDVRALNFNTTLSSKNYNRFNQDDLIQFDKLNQIELIDELLAYINEIKSSIIAFNKEHSQFTYYINIQLCRHLLLHDSMRQLEIWLPELHIIEKISFKNKQEINDFIAKMEAESAIH